MLKKLILAGAFAISAVAAQATTVIDNGLSTTVTMLGDNEFEFSVNPSLAGSFIHTFSLDPTTVGTGEAFVSVTPNRLDLFEGLALSWLDEANEVLATIDVGVGLTSLSTIFTPPNLTQKFLVSWESSTSATSFDGDVTITVQPVPLPAGVLLMGTALAGFGVARRRKKS